MLAVYQASSFIALGVFIATLFYFGYFHQLRPSSLFIVFFVLQYGPIFLSDVRHPSDSDFISGYGISDFGMTIAEYTYAAFTVAYLGLSVGFISVNFLLQSIFKHKREADYRIADVIPPAQEYARSIYFTLVMICVICAALFFMIDIVRQKLEFFASLLTGHINAIDYRTFRRITLGTDPTYREIIRLRLNVFIPLMALMAAWGSYLRRPLFERIFFFIGFSIVTIFDLTKQGTVIAILVFVVATYVARKNGALPRIRALIVPLILISSASVVLLFSLYALQYAGVESMNWGKIGSVLLYRVSGLNADGLNLYFVFFQHPLFDRGITTSPVLASIFDKQVLDETLYIPQVYGLVTSFPTVYFGGMWVDFGWPGIAVSSLAVGVICALSDYVATALRCAPIRAAYVSCAMFSLNYFNQVQFLTCLLSFGVAMIPLAFLTLDYLTLRINQRSTAPINAVLTLAK